MSRSGNVIDAGWSSLVARRAHNPEVVGSNPTPATKAVGRKGGRAVGQLVTYLPVGLPVCRIFQGG